MYFDFKRYYVLSKDCQENKLSRNILKTMNSRNADDFTPKSTCLQDLTLYGMQMVTMDHMILVFTDAQMGCRGECYGSPSNKMPEILAKHHLHAVKQYGMSVNIKVADRTEHIQYSPFNYSLNYGGDPDLDSFSIVISPRNGRIVAFWLFLERSKIGWWKQFIQDMIDLNLI